ncbi:MAG: protein TrsL [Tetragenococcus koreensis]|nr:protein TrsL [Tetragenococcus koreensis]MDN6195168.1 protein TrsL [Atopostipes suicloacalis]MDN6640712.1 protein TrsL [Tetragenococcus sp.]MDN6145936.1 protein TrsL [Tetragenococcus koreensis]MDN6165561.1 protein TrsL [Tetragenococcus koreensis]
MFDVGKKINEWASNIISGILKWVIDLSKETVKLLEINMDAIDKYYAIFLGFATSLVIAVVLARIIGTLLKQADDTTDSTWANIITDSVKSAVSIPIMIFIQGFLLRMITIPLITFAFDDAKGLSMKSVKHASNVATGNGSGYGYGVPLLIMAFFLIVLGVFFFKIGRFFADMAFFTISIPLVGVSIATESFDYASTWWKKLVYINLTIIAQTIALAIMVASFTLLDKGWGYLAITFGFGALIINPPAVLQDMWQSTGMGKAAAMSSTRIMGNMMRKR